MLKANSTKSCNISMYANNRTATFKTQNPQGEARINKNLISCCFPSKQGTLIKIDHMLTPKENFIKCHPAKIIKNII